MRWSLYFSRWAVSVSGSVARLGADLCALFFLCHKGERLVINMVLLFCVSAGRRLKLLHTV